MVCRIIILLTSIATLSFSASADSNNVKDASVATAEANNALYKIYPFKNTSEFDQAQKGFIAPLPNNGVVKDEDGNVVWDLSKYQAYIEKDAKSPDTINPSLFRQAKLMMYAGLFEVVPGVYQVRGADLSNMTIVEGSEGITIYDPLISTETAKYALELYYTHRPKKPVKAVIYTHSHVDHFGGVRGIVDEADVVSGKIKIYAPEGFMEHAVSENVYAGTAMSRRATYMYGNLLPQDATGQATAGLGVTTSTGHVTIIPPTNTIKKTGEKHNIDGLEYEFVMAPNSEAPSEMMWYMPYYKLINTSEDAVYTMHNLYTLRGAKTRDARLWPQYLNEVMKRWGDQYEVAIAMHHWPTWGKDNITSHIKAQRDIYKYMHDQTLHFANQGYTMNELPDLVVIPQSLVDVWGVHGYYGSQSHNVRAVYNYYLGYFDGNPSHLNPLPPQEIGKRYVKALGAEKIIKLGKEALKDGDYRWGAELLNHLVFAQPDNRQAKELLADHLEQMGYQAESGPWRNFYLSGAQELRSGVQDLPAPNTASADIISNMPLDLVFDYMGIQLNAERANGKNITVNVHVPDNDELKRYTLFLENSVINYWPDYQVKNPDVSIEISRGTLNDILNRKMDTQQAYEQNLLQISGDKDKLFELLGYLDDLNKSFWFNIVTP